MDQNREFCCDKSRLGVLKIPGGLDRSWETKRLQGLEMLGQSVELQKERSNQRNASQENPAKKKSRHKKRHHANVALASELFQDLHATDSNDISKSRIPEDYVLKLEYQLQELSKQFVAERQKNRQEKLYIARLQQDLARLKSERPFKEMIAKELEKEQRLRLETEHRLSRLTAEFRDCRDRESSLEDELKKMSDFAQSLSVYKSKFEEFQHEGFSSSAGFNSSAVHCDDGEKTKVLLERLRRLEAEKTSLVLENENQNHAYENCLDEITSQVLEALMSQRSLKEECIKLQNRVFSLQQQNVHLRKVFHQQFFINPDTSSCIEQTITTNGKSKSKLCCPFIGVSLSSLNSVFSDQDQMNCLLSQMNSPSIDLQDCLIENSATDVMLSAALGRDCAAIRENCEEEEEEEEDGKDISGKSGIGGVFRSSDQNNKIPAWSRLFNPKLFPVLEPNSSDIQTFENYSGIQKIPDKSQSCFSSSSREKTNDEILKLLRNEEFNQVDFIDSKLSFDFGFDLNTVDDIRQPKAHLDTGSTVSLNELLDLAVIDFDDDLTLTETSIDHHYEAQTSQTKSLPYAGSNDITGDDLRTQKDGHDTLTFPEHSTKVLLPDVCPDNRNMKHV